MDMIHSLDRVEALLSDANIREAGYLNRPNARAKSEEAALSTAPREAAASRRRSV